MAIGQESQVKKKVWVKKGEDINVYMERTLNSPKVGLQNVTRHYASECKTHEKTTVSILKDIT